MEIRISFAHQNKRCHGGSQNWKFQDMEGIEDSIIEEIDGIISCDESASKLYIA